MSNKEKETKTNRRVTDFLKTIVRGGKALVVKYHFKPPKERISNYLKFLFGILRNDAAKYETKNTNAYNKWLEENKEETVYETLKYKPLISVLIPVYNVKAEYLKKCIDSVLNQSYDNFEICIVDDASTRKETITALKKYKKNEKIKIKYRNKNGHISRATNDALKMAEGEFVALVDNDDVLDRDALYEVALALNKNRKLDLIYSDEDKLNEKEERCYPHFKADFSPDTLMSVNYICHLVAVRTEILRQIGGFEVGLEGVQDYDMLLKVTEKTNNIYHIPKVLYHWRKINGSTSLDESEKKYVKDMNAIVLKNALKRRKIKGRVVKDKIYERHAVIYEYASEPMVSIIIPIKDHADITETCLKSVYKKTTYKNFEVIVVDNNSEKPETFELLEKYKRKYRNFRVIDAKMEFNYSKINNLAIKKAKGKFLILLNNDTEIISPNWISVMVGYAMQPHIGAVGAKLLYPDDTVQHVGVVLGFAGVAGHAQLGISREDRGAFDRARVPYDWGAVTAACLCIEKKKFNKVGGLEEKLKVAFNDVDLNIKLLEAGYYNVCVPMVELHHYESKSRGLDVAAEKRKRFEQEIKYMKDKWEKYLKNDPFYNPNLSLERDFVLRRKKDV